MTLLASPPSPETRKPAPPMLHAAIGEALGRIPPLWPLTHFVAVNPFVGLTGVKFDDACALLRRTTGRAPLMDSAGYRAEWAAGEITEADLAAVADGKVPVAKLIKFIETEATPGARPIQTVADLLDAGHPHAHWGGFVVEEIAKWCAVAFDGNQTTWSSPWRGLGLFCSWREAASHDRNPESFGITGFRSFVRSLPDDAEQAIARCLAVLDPQEVSLTDFLHRQLATVSGWAGHIRYRVREDELRGNSNSALVDLLAIRLAYDAALFEVFARNGEFRSDWRRQPSCDGGAAMDALIRWQSAYELAWQRKLAAMLEGDLAPQPTARDAVQAVFCIDVRSEVFRRHLEAAMPGLRTIGFAGFFGFPLEHRHAGEESTSARCPVLLVPPVRSAESACESKERESRASAGAWKAFQNSAISCFPFVESAGLLFSGALAKGRTSRKKPRPAPVLDDAPPEQKADLAEGALRNMGLTDGFARLVLICGHGSRCSNNPYASALECGACGGHAGDVNARIAADTLNDPAVRKLLAARGIAIPDDTWFLAGLHVTVTDEVELPGGGDVPKSHAADLNTLTRALAEAGTAARRERAPAFGLTGLDDDVLLAAFAARSSDISQVRPEWGLANNAAFLAAPRARTRGLNLNGRVFLHDYDAASDPDLKRLTLILTAPVVVASWINLQYYASRVDPRRYGSGDKALHHVIGGIGVAEGNGGDLKCGLPLQSIHDGTRFTHEPRRLTVVIEAARTDVDRVLAAHGGVRDLFENGWIHLQVIESGLLHRRNTDGTWSLFTNPQLQNI